MDILQHAEIERKYSAQPVACSPRVDLAPGFCARCGLLLGRIRTHTILGRNRGLREFKL
jgi:hypothetical protein